MTDTSLSLLDCLRQEPESNAWDRLVVLYSPLVRAWLRRYDVDERDVDDLMQDVFLSVSRGLPKFEHRGHTGAFRAWLKAILVNRLRNFWRTRDRRPREQSDAQLEARLSRFEDPSSGVSKIWEREHDQFVLHQLLALSRPHFQSDTWNAFTRVALDGDKPVDVAKELGMSPNAVIVAKCRVLRRLREESAGLVESSSNFFTNR